MVTPDGRICRSHPPQGRSRETPRSRRVGDGVVSGDAVGMFSPPRLCVARVPFSAISSSSSPVRISARRTAARSWLQSPGNHRYRRGGMAGSGSEFLEGFRSVLAACRTWLPQWLIGGDRRAVRCGSDTFSANSAVFLRLFPYCRRSAAMRFRFHARHTRVHSFWTWASPRARNWRNPSTDLMIPNTGSTLCLRSA